MSSAWRRSNVKADVDFPHLSAAYPTEPGTPQVSLPLVQARASVNLTCDALRIELPPAACGGELEGEGGAAATAVCRDAAAGVIPPPPNTELGGASDNGDKYTWPGYAAAPGERYHAGQDSVASRGVC